jgi:hypothetical protein
MFTSQIISSRDGLHYTLRLVHQCIGSLPKALTPECFNNPFEALFFLNNLQVPAFFWEHLAHDNSFYSYPHWRNANPGKRIEEYIAQALTQGSICVYKTMSFNEQQKSRQSRSFKNALGKRFELLPVASLLMNTRADVKPVLNKVDAEKVLQDLNITAESANSLTQSLNLPTSSDSSSHNSSHNSSDSNSIDVLITALVNGDIVLTQKPETLKPAPKANFIEEVVNKAQESLGPAAPVTPTEPAAPTTSPTRTESATANGLIKASEEGTPFCEECEKAANAV